MAWKDEVDAKICRAIEELSIHESQLISDKYVSHSIYPYHCIPRIPLTSVILTLIQRQNELAAHLGLEWKYEPPVYEKVTLVKKGK